MSKTYFVQTVLGIPFNEINIKKVLKKSCELGFIYYDHICGERYENSPILNYEEAFAKWDKQMKNPDDDHALFVEISKGRFAHLWLYKSEDGYYLEYHLGSFSYVKEKYFEDSFTSIDFKYYIEIALQLGDDFGIEKLVADHID